MSNNAIMRDHLQLEKLARQMVYLDAQTQREPHRKAELQTAREDVQRQRSDLLVKVWQREHQPVPTP